MKNKIVCVTKQKNCDRLISFGKELADKESSTLTILHVARHNEKFLDKDEELEALDYLYEKSREADANLTVIKSDQVPQTIAQVAKDTCADTIILGQRNNAYIHNDSDFLEKLSSLLPSEINLLTV